MRILLLPLMLAVSLPAWGWKIHTHIWLADQLYDELASAESVRIGRLGEYDVPPIVRHSILANRGAFLLGVLGPDIYPDMVGGQMTTHPGLAAEFDGKLPAPVRAALTVLNQTHPSEPGWQTDDWLDWVRDGAFEASDGQPSAEIAMAYGYLIHAAMDMWAHTYVNLYSGDMFSILENQEVAARHAAIESFVKNVHAGFMDHPATTQSSKQARHEIGRVGKQPARLSMGKADDLTPLHGPAPFVRRHLILNADVANQYARSEGAMHIWAMYAYWREVGRLEQQLQPLKSTVNNAFNDANQVLNGAQQAFDTADQTLQAAREASDQAYTALQNAEQQALDAADSFDAAKDNLLGLFTAITDQALAAAPKWMRDTYEQAKAALESANNALDAARMHYENLREARDQAQTAMDQAAGNLNLSATAHGALQIARQQMVPAIDAAVVQWRRNIESAVDAYVVAWEETAKEIMRPHGARFTPGSDATGPLKQWVACWGPTFGLAPPLAARGCQAGLTHYDTTRSRLESLATNAILPGFVRDAVETFDARTQTIGAQLLNHVAAMVSGAIRIDDGMLAGSTAFAVQFWDKEVSLQELHAEFADDHSGRDLFVYGDDLSITSFLAQDMGVPADSRGLGLAQLSRFAPLQNSMTMARLTLLDGKALNRLVTDRNIRRTIYSKPPRSAGLAAGQPLYFARAAPGEVLVGALRNIDGNHQWLEVAPRMPRDPPGAPQPSQTCLRFGYPVDRYPNRCDTDRKPPARKGGLRLWQDPVVRERVFKQAFQGPLAPALCKRLGRGNLDPRIGCEGNPFPAMPAQAPRRQPGSGPLLQPFQR